MQVAVDAVVFTVMHDELKILLIKRKYPPFENKYALPGGFVERDEELNVAARRELEEETNVKNIFLKQLGTYGGVARDPRGRVISVAFLALIRPDQELKATTDARSAEWHSVYALPKVAFDHTLIIQDALKQLRYEIQTTNIAFQILQQKFTLSDLQRLHELILDRELDKRNFRKKIKELGILKETQETSMEGAHRPAKLFSFMSSSYVGIGEKVSVYLEK